MYRAPRFPLQNPFSIKVMCIDRNHFQRYLAVNFGAAFMWEVMNSPIPVILPIVSYGQEWDVTIYVLV